MNKTFSTNFRIFEETRKKLECTNHPFYKIISNGKKKEAVEVRVDDKTLTYMIMTAKFMISANIFEDWHICQMLWNNALDGYLMSIDNVETFKSFIDKYVYCMVRRYKTAIGRTPSKHEVIALLLQFPQFMSMESIPQLNFFNLPSNYEMLTRVINL